jgi:hypothetical protein
MDYSTVLVGSTLAAFLFYDFRQPWLRTTYMWQVFRPFAGRQEGRQEGRKAGSKAGRKERRMSKRKGKKGQRDKGKKRKCK